MERKITFFFFSFLFYLSYPIICTHLSVMIPHLETAAALLFQSRFDQNTSDDHQRKLCFFVFIQNLFFVVVSFLFHIKLCQKLIRRGKRCQCCQILVCSLKVWLNPENISSFKINICTLESEGAISSVSCNIFLNT